MPRDELDEFELTEGAVRDLLASEGFSSFVIANRTFALVDPPARRALHEGDLVRVLSRRIHPATLGDVVVLQRLSDGKLRYTGPRIGPVIALAAAGLCAIGLHAGLWTLTALLAVPAAVIAYVLACQQQRVMRAFHLLLKQASRSVAPARDVPLDVTHVTDHSILEFTHDAIIIWEMEGRGIVYWNRAAELLYGYSREDALGKVTHELLQTELAGGGVGELESKLARYGVWVGELRHTRSDGEQVEVEARLALMSRERGAWLVLEVNRDITDRKRAEASRAEMQARLERLTRPVEGTGHPPSH